MSQTYRMAPDDADLLRAEAERRGLTMQQLFELKMLGAARPAGRSGRLRKKKQDEELPIAG